MVAAKTYEIIEGPRDREIFTADSFLAHLRLANDHWWPNKRTDKNFTWVFRGHADSTWKLIPKAAHERGQRRFESIFLEIDVDQSLANVRNDKTPEQYLAAKAVFAANKVLEEFKILAEELRLAENLEEVDKHSAKEFIEIAGSAGYKQSRAAVLAQHHNIPTFLLDWTKSPEIAALFATETPQRDYQKDIAVFALKRTSNPLPTLANNEFGYGFVDAVPSRNLFLYAQQGLFTEYRELMPYMRDGVFKPLEDAILLYEDFFDDVLLKKIVLKSTEVPRLRKLLEREKYTKAHVMPTLDNVAKTILSRLTLS